MSAAVTPERRIGGGKDVRLVVDGDGVASLVMPIAAGALASVAGPGKVCLVLMRFVHFKK